jgi:DNA excision repair protein ERCC-5
MDAAMEADAPAVRAARRDAARARVAADAPTPEMFAEVQEMLALFGIPFMVAPSEAEAQCAALDAAGLVDGVATDDNDVFLFGGRRVYRHLFAEARYVEEYVTADVERELGLGRADLVALAHLLGCDYTEGVAGVGVVNAVEILRAFAGAGGGDARLAAFRAWMDAPDERLAAAMGVTVDGEAAANDIVADFKRRHRRARTLWQVPASFPDPAVTAAFLDPRVDTSSARFVQVAPAADELRAWCERVFGWSADKAAGLLEPALKVRKRRRGGGATARRSNQKKKPALPPPPPLLSVRHRPQPAAGHHAPLPVVPAAVCQVSVGPAEARGGGHRGRPQRRHHAGGEGEERGGEAQDTAGG